MLKKSPKILARFFISFILSFILIALVFNNESRASNMLLGGAIGFGGAGIKQAQTDATNGDFTAEKSEGPGVISLFAESLISDNSSFGYEHSRGFRFGPFSSGISFYGINHRLYFMGPAPAYPKPEPHSNFLFTKQYAPYFAYGIGLATASIVRKNDLAPSISGSGAYINFKLGMDYSTKPGGGMRYEIHYATTFFSSEAPATTINEFALLVGSYFFWD